MRIGADPQVVFDTKLDRMSFYELVDFLDIDRAYIQSSWIVKRAYNWQYQDALDAYEETLCFCPECCDHFDDPDDMEGELCWDCHARVVNKRKQLENPYTVDDKIDELRGK